MQSKNQFYMVLERPGALGTSFFIVFVPERRSRAPSVIVLIVFGMLNLITAVIVDAAAAARERDM